MEYLIVIELYAEPTEDTLRHTVDSRIHPTNTQSYDRPIGQCRISSDRNHQIKTIR